MNNLYMINEVLLKIGTLKIALIFTNQNFGGWN